MLRRVAALVWSPCLRCAADPASLVQESAAVATAPKLLTRFLAAVPEPDPELNPAPSQKVLDIADAIETLTVKEVVWLNRTLKDRLGITDADLGVGVAAVAAPAPAAGAEPEDEAPAAQEKTDFSVVIEGYDSASKIKIIKELRAIVPDLELKEAKALVDNVPATVKEKIPKAAAEEVQKQLVAVGAQVVLK